MNSKLPGSVTSRLQSASRERDVHAAADVFQRYLSIALRYAERRIPPKLRRLMDGEDVMQRVAMRILQITEQGRLGNSAGEYQNREQFLAWLYLVTFREGISQARSKSAKRDRRQQSDYDSGDTPAVDKVADDGLTPDEIAEANEQSHRAKELLAVLEARLNSQEREVFRLYFVEDMKRVQVAEMLLTSEGKVAAMVKAIRKQASDLVKHFPALFTNSTDS
jgi:RNA polymerase sigma factor (sigma-70 family)